MCPRPKTDGGKAFGWLAGQVITIIVVSREAMAVGRKARKAQDGNLGQADSHDGQVPRQGHDGEDAPYPDVQCLEDMDAADDSCGVDKGDEAQDLDPFHPLILAQSVPLDVVIEKTEGGMGKEGGRPLPYPDCRQAEAHSIEPLWPRWQRLLVHGRSLSLESPSQSGHDYVHLGR